MPPLMRASAQPWPPSRAATGSGPSSADSATGCQNCASAGCALVNSSDDMSLSSRTRAGAAERASASPSARPRHWSAARLTKLTSKLTLTWRLSEVADEDDAAVMLDSMLEALANPHRREIVYVL